MVAKQFSECRRRTAVLKVCSNDEQRGPSVNRNDDPDHNAWLRACAPCNSKRRIGMLPWASPDTSSMIVRTQLEAGFVSKHYRSPVSMFQSDRTKHDCNLTRQRADANGRWRRSRYDRKCCSISRL
ncbi:hypothetical protein TNCV_1477591 [Trichonephila clavipes]|nr:hypothetical protein TNCV_1477591 [Trichonephila clavipes]